MSLILSRLFCLFFLYPKTCSPQCIWWPKQWAHYICDVLSSEGSHQAIWQEVGVSWHIYWVYASHIIYHSRYLQKWITFQKCGPFVNLSRVNPKLLSKSQENAYGASFLVEPGRNNGFLMAISMMVINSSSLLTLKMSTKGDWGQKKVGGTLLSQEMERLAGCLGMVFGFTEVEASMYRSELYFMAKREYLSRPSMFMNILFDILIDPFL